MGSYMQSGDASKRKRYPEPASRPDEMVPMPPRRDALDLYVAAHLAMLHRGTALSSEWTRHDAAIWDRCKATWRSVSPSDKHLIDDIVMREQHFYEIYWAHAAPMGGMVHRSTVRGWEKHTEMFTEQLLGKIRIDCSVLLPGQAPSITANIQAGSSISHLGGTMQHSSRPNGHLHSSYFDPSYSMLPNPTPQRTVHHDLLGLPGQTISPLAGNFYPGSPSQYNALLRGNGMSIPLPQANTVPSSLTPVRSPRPAPQTRLNEDAPREPILRLRVCPL
ncbi:uncharacterized protein EI90DRAFT_2279912 [Cantharellus anzutake]|uniref:uncharacterized protein n=1 Tax=Cantharellus anzutake TaxID=1750568 RepID=UPI001902FC44|nr:uncharacterized protein EI90DRAFT_2279912 [Cantharellus anzutake]KAF8339753.1 hypothetical protein EI90DRAFT_2279912 [Cantharellus anzutake]